MRRKEEINQSAGHFVIRRQPGPEQRHSTAWAMKAGPQTMASGRRLLVSSYMLVCMDNVHRAGISKKVNQIRNLWNGKFLKMARVTILSIVPSVVKSVNMLFFAEVHDRRKTIWYIITYCSLKWKDHTGLTHRILETIQSSPLWCLGKPKGSAGSGSTASSPEGRAPSLLPHSGTGRAIHSVLCPGFHSRHSCELPFTQRNNSHLWMTAVFFCYVIFSK